MSSTTSITLLKLVNHQFILSWCVILVLLILHVLYSNYGSDCSKVKFFMSSLHKDPGGHFQNYAKTCTIFSHYPASLTSALQKSCYINIEELIEGDQTETKQKDEKRKKFRENCGKMTGRFQRRFSAKLCKKGVECAEMC